MPTVSVIMPCWNAAETLDEAVGSVVAQTFEDWELVLVDDGSSDGSASRLLDWARRDSRIRVVRKDHGGIVETLRLGCADARGDYFARMDADDICHPDRIARQLDSVRRSGAMTLCGTHVETIGDGVQSGRKRFEDWINSLVDHDDIARERFVECPIAHPTFFASRACFERIGYADQPGPEDYDFVLRAYDAGVQLMNVPQKLLRWRDRPERLCLNDDRYGPGRFRAMKRRHLLPVIERTGKPMWQWGAGEVGKVWLREWASTRPEAVIDINPRKFGKRIHDFEVVEPDALPGPGNAVVVVAVGAPGARDEIRDWFGARGHVEARDYWFVA